MKSSEQMWGTGRPSPVATRNVDVTAVPTNIATALTLNQAYSIQNVDPSAPIYLRVAAVMPTGGALRGHVIPPFGFGYPTPSPGVGVWVWTDPKHAPARAVITEAS